MNKKIVLWLPLTFFVLIGLFFVRGLTDPANSTIKSQLIGKPLPKFSLEPATTAGLGLGSVNFQQGKPRLLNVFASWCVPCAAEAPQLLQLAQSGVEIDAIAIRDKPQDVQRFLERWGNPYTRIGSDPNSSVQIALGSSGVPETFVIDGKGIIRYQHIGDIRPEDIPAIMNALALAR